MAVAPYCCYEKVCRTMRTTILLYLFKICLISKSKVTENIFNLLEWLQNTWSCKSLLSKPLFLSKHSPLKKKKLKPAKNTQLWFVVAWYMFFIRRPPFQDGHFWVVSKVVVLRRFDCIVKTYLLMVLMLLIHLILKQK